MVGMTRYASTPRQHTLEVCAHRSALSRRDHLLINTPSSVRPVDVRVQSVRPHTHHCPNHHRHRRHLHGYLFHLPKEHNSAREGLLVIVWEAFQFGQDIPLEGARVVTRKSLRSCDRSRTQPVAELGVALYQ